MSILQFPQDVVCPKEIVCALCGRDIERSLVTVGPVNADGAANLRRCSSSFPWLGSTKIIQQIRKVPDFIVWDFLFILTSVILVRVWEG